MESSYAFTCQLCRARLTLVGNIEAAESVTWAGPRGLLVPPHLQASVFDHSNVDESFIVLDGKRQGGLLPHPCLPTSPQQTCLLQTQEQQQQQQQGQQGQGQQGNPPGLQHHQQQQLLPPPPQQQQLQPLLPIQDPRSLPQQQPLQPPPRGLEESFVVLGGGAASVLRPTHGSHPPHPRVPNLQGHPSPAGVVIPIPTRPQALQQQMQQQQQQQGMDPSVVAAMPCVPQPPQPPLQQQQQLAQQQQQQQLAQHSAAGPKAPSMPPLMAPSPPPLSAMQHAANSSSSSSLAVVPAASASQQPPYTYLQPPYTSQSPPQPTASLRRGSSSLAVGGGGGLQQAAAAEPDLGYGSPGGAGGGGGGGPAGSGLDSKLQALAQLFELASTNTQVDHPLCMDCVGQLKEEMETQIAEAEREIAAYSACLMQLEATLPGAAAATATAAVGGGKRGEGLVSGTAATETASAAGSLVSEPSTIRDAEEYQLEEISRLEQERDQERARAEVLESELAAVVSELASLSATAADLDSLEERYWHDVNDFELLLRAHTEERGALLAKIDRAGQRLQLLKNTSVLYDAFKIWHDGPFGTISGFRLGRTPEVSIEWDEINAAWGQAVLLLHTMAQMCKLQFSQHRLLPMGSHPRVADKRATYDLFGPVSKLWSANYDRAMVAYLACLREFGEFARKKDLQDGKPTQFNFPFAIDGDKVNNHTIKLTLNKDVRWTKALKFMLANLKIALQWCVRQDQNIEFPQLRHLEQEKPQLLQEH